MILVPQHILEKIPFYTSELESALRTTGPNVLPTIMDAKIPDAGEEAFIKAVDFMIHRWHSAANHRRSWK